MGTEILVPFAGEGAGQADLTWGQLQIWATLCAQGHSLPPGGVMLLPESSTLEQVISMLRHSMSRHQSLRTLLLFGQDADGGLRQEAHNSGEVPLLVVDAEEGEDARQVAADLLKRLADKRFDYAAEWPVRHAVVRQGGVLAHSVIAYCHLAVDAHALRLLFADLAELDFSTGSHPVPNRAAQPMEVARAEREPERLRQHEATVRRWRRQLAKAPAQRFRETGDERMPYYWRATPPRRTWRPG
jgi:Condensation domain